MSTSVAKTKKIQGSPDLTSLAMIEVTINTYKTKLLIAKPNSNYG